ncbi:Fc receptor-like protein 5 isoform X1 [Girardinichthys multiradiatus]|uniref:Fc receptor-like protein 5 isoform X1 n=1 Tax=Girardinichthys multiradiatus TaxID=208333 RepID=UPI001FAE5DC5|nr:Fc receptor-like protein 5 isoform X1 [Girardinichthys multiradiatus]XP_047241780.1 Fc receptor-like protein 5 isoform X1 [Girardinichthys multiradiatus]XP_047241781.1 Fc receptor-like protein 5 isoform X1 [Girardinichthys multiradiatus]XP_047241782.1 Fc receptor-like protein 5 isoform X1 [Girardinichthys multiradiatus]
MFVQTFAFSRTEQLQPGDMKTALLLLLWFSCCQMSSMHASLMLTPSRSQFYEYEKVSISCEQFLPDIWTVWRYTETGLRVSQCAEWGDQTSSTCSIRTLKKSHSGVYWCESKHRDSSNVVNITVTEDPVILQSPLLPVDEGQDVTLSCRCKDRSSDLEAYFFKDGIYIRTEPTGQMILHDVSRSSEGGYKCNISGKTSPTSWLLIKDVSKPASLTVSPDSAQVFEYKSFSLSCNTSGSQGWTVKRNSTDGKMISRCGGNWGKNTSSGCTISTAKKSDSATYWCESPSKQRSNTVQITVYADTPVLLQSPALPVHSGDNVTLSCQTKTSSNLPAAFIKDGSLIRTEPTGHMTLHHVTSSDEGVYRCNISGHGESPSSWLFVRAPSASDVHPSTAMLTLRIITHIAAWSSYIYPTYIIFFRCRHRPTGRSPPGPDRTSAPREEAEEGGADYDDAMAPVTTEHRF